ncbi:hypothetical protein NIES4101_83690 [Calothrix sp. NIES-4101]|nr:hypothetical protein NIES4101_83690 [Calothrix sp. NIES-4101]
MLVFIFTLIFNLLLGFTVISPAEAFTCRDYNNHKIYILSIKRSAKNYWEYRASVIIDGVRSPVEMYDCRQRVRIGSDRNLIAFGEDDGGELICSFFKMSSPTETANKKTPTQEYILNGH